MSDEDSAGAVRRARALGPIAAIIDSFTPDVAVLDIGLPGMDGYDLARRLREHPLPRCRIIAVTGYGLQADRERARHAGFDAYLVKPVNLAELVRRIAEPSSSEPR